MPARSITIVPEPHKSRLAQQIMFEYMDKLKQKFNESVLIINPLLLPTRDRTSKYHEIYTAIQRYKPHHIILTCWAEPHWLSGHNTILETIIKPVGIPYTLFGCYTHKDAVFFDFFILAFDRYRPTYSNNELLPINPTKLFLNYNRGHRPHRFKFVEQLESSGLIAHGHVSLDRPGNMLVINESLPKFEEAFLPKTVGSDEPLFAIPNDPFSLGDLAIWRDHLVHVVSDGWWVEKPDQLGGTYLNEKNWKPLLGLRPFLYNGGYDGYVKLKELGVDMFEDQFPGDMATVDHCHTTIIKALTKLSALSDLERMEWYNSLLPRLLSNQQLYYSLVDNAKTTFEDFTCRL